jgi:hypothetical protein
MVNRSLALLVVLCFVTPVSPRPFVEEKDSASLQSKLKVTLEEGQSVPAKGGAIPVVLTFSNQTGKEEKFTIAEYRIALLNKDGEQVQGALTFSIELRDIVLKAGSTKDKPGVSVQPGKLKGGEEYFLVVSVRNLIGHVKFTAK